MLYSFLLIGFDLLNIAVRIFAFIPMLVDDAPSLSGEYHTETSCLMLLVSNLRTSSMHGWLVKIR